MEANNANTTDGQNRLAGKKIAILVEKGFEQIELTEPKRALEEAGAQTHIISPQREKVRGWKHTEWGDEFDVDVHVDQADPSQYDAVLLPGGVMNPDKLRMSERAVQFVRHFYDQGKPIASICHGPWMLAEADVVKRRTITSYPSIKTDLENAGAKWVDEEVVVDKGIVTSRKPDDIPAFNQKMIEEIAEGKHGKRHSRRARKTRPGQETHETPDQGAPADGSQPSRPRRAEASW